MPGLTAINNTYTANTPQGVRECLYFLQQQGRSRSDRFRSYPISIVYGHGAMGGGQLVMAGDDLDIVPTQWDHLRKRRWWDVSNTASGQMLLPFPEHSRVRIISINRYSNATEVVIQTGTNRHSQFSLTAPRVVDVPGPYTVRAIRIHNIDGTETVPPMQPTADEIPHTAYSAGDMGVGTASSPYPHQMVNSEVEDAPERPIDNIFEWHAVVETQCREQAVCDEPPHAVRPGPGRPARPGPGRCRPVEVSSPSSGRGPIPQNQRDNTIVPMREIVTRADAGGERVEWGQYRELDIVSQGRFTEMDIAAAQSLMTYGERRSSRNDT